MCDEEFHFFCPIEMSQEVIDNILAFINEEPAPATAPAQPPKACGPGGTPMDASAQPQAPPAQPQPAAQQSNVPAPAQPDKGLRPGAELMQSGATPIDSLCDDVKFKAFSRKCSRQSTFPVVIDGRVFQSKDELTQFKHDIIVRRRQNRQSSNEKKVKETRMKTEALPEVPSDEEHVIEHEGMMYRVTQPYAIKVGDKVKKLPTTSKRDRKAIVDEIQQKKGKEGLAELVRAEDDKFAETAEKLTSDSDAELKDMLYNHLHNEFVNDKTFSKQSYINFMRQLMEENKRLNRALNDRTPHAQPSQQHAAPNPFGSNPLGLNPKLFNR